MARFFRNTNCHFQRVVGGGHGENMGHAEFALHGSSHVMWFKASLLLSMVLSPADIRGVTSVSQLEQLNKRYWYVCQDFTECKYPHQPKRFPEIMMCLPEIRCIAGKSPQKSLLSFTNHSDATVLYWKPQSYVSGKLVNIPLEQLPLLFKAVLHSCKSSLNGTYRSTGSSPCPPKGTAPANWGPAMTRMSSISTKVPWRPSFAEAERG